MEAFVIYLFLAAFVLASTALSWWGGYQMGCEEGTAPSVNDREDLYRGNPISRSGSLHHRRASKSVFLVVNSSSDRIPASRSSPSFLS